MVGKENDLEWNAPDSSSPGVCSAASSESSSSSSSSERASLLDPTQDFSKSLLAQPASETSTLLATTSASTASSLKIAHIIIPLLLLGVFLSSVDGSIVNATYGLISSTFNAFSNASWLSTSFVLAECAIQPLIGKISDVYGPKNVLLVSYILFAFGSLLTGMGQAMWQVILGRVVTGAGAAGMGVIVSILITDIVPLIEVASYRSYVNVMATLGRSIGGPLGGFLADTIGWRWSFIGQAPLISIAIILVGFRLPSIRPPETVYSQGKQPSKLQRIDVVGAIMLASTIVTLLGALSLGGQALPWFHPIVTSLVVGSFFLGAAFVVYEAKVPLEPIFPPSLMIRRDIATPCAIMGLQISAQVGMMYSIPLYFRVTQNSSNTVAGAHLFPAVLGNTAGGLLAGYFITRTGTYKSLLFVSSLSSSLTYLLLFLFWEGKTSWLESLEIIPGGFGTGVAYSATFIALQGSIEKTDMAMATGAMFMCSSFGMVIGVAGASASQMAGIRSILAGKVSNDIIEKVIEDVGKIPGLDEGVRKIVIGAYVRALAYSHLLSLGSALLALLIACTIRERRLK